MKKILKILLNFSPLLILLVIILFFLFSEKTNKKYEWYYEKMKINKVNKNLKNKDIIIAILDSGINKTEYKTYSPKIFKPYNFIKNSEDVFNDSAHGTNMVSLILGNKEMNIDGISPNSIIMPLVVVGETQPADNDRLSLAIEYAIDNNADIISISLGSKLDHPNVRKNIERAILKNIIVVAASGDTASDKLLFPAAYNGVIGVSAQSQLGRKYINTNANNNSLFIPGENIKVVSYVEDIKKNEYRSGSSYSTAILSGIIALKLQKENDKKKLLIQLNNYKRKLTENDFFNVEYFLKNN